LPQPAVKAVIPDRWEIFLKEGEQVGLTPACRPRRNPREVEYVAKKNVLPVRICSCCRPAIAEPAPSWVQDYALFLLDVDERIAAWYGGAERIYGFSAAEAVGSMCLFSIRPESSPPQRLWGVKPGRQ